MSNDCQSKLAVGGSSRRIESGPRYLPMAEWSNAPIHILIYRPVKNATLFRLNCVPCKIEISP